MEPKSFYIKYLTNQPVKVESHYIGDLDRKRPLSDVGDLVAAYKSNVVPLLDHFSIAQLTLHLPNGVARSALADECFATVDEADTTLRTGLALTRLNDFGFDDIHPLIIKSNDSGLGTYLSYSSRLYARTADNSKNGKFSKYSR
jgi:hypothetical protein